MRDIPEWESVSRHSHRGWTRLVANKEKTECLTFEIWPVCLSLGQLQVRTWECKLSKNKNKKKLNSGPPLLGMQPSTQLCLYIHTEGTHVYMRVWIYKIHRNCMEDTRMWAVKKQRKYHHRPYGIRDARIIPVHSYIIPNKKIIDITCAAPTVHYIFVAIDHIF